MDHAQVDALQAQVLQLQQQLQQALQQMPAVPPPTPVVFARTPALINGANMLDYSTKKDTELYKEGSKGITGDKYDGTKLQQFLTKVEAKARSFSMLPILTINNELLTCNYGVITKEQTLAAAMVYKAAQVRDAQN